MRSFLFAAFLSLFAGQALALGVNITLGGELQTVNLTDALAPVDPALAACSSQCNNATSAINACAPTDDGCLCGNVTVPAVVSCEQCMFEKLLSDNRRPQDPRAGSTAVLTAYAASCNATGHAIDITQTPIALTLPSNWDGPFGQGLTTLGTVVSVAAAALIGGGMIGVVNTM